MTPVIYERIDSNNVRIGTKWFCYRRGIDILNPMKPGVMIFDGQDKRFVSNDWYNLNTSGTYEEFERSFELWIKSL